MQTLTIIECKLEVTDDGFYSLKCGLFLLSLWRSCKFLGNFCWPYNLPCHCWRNQLLLFVHGHWFFFFNMGHGGSSWKQKILTWKALDTSDTVNIDTVNIPLVGGNFSLKSRLKSCGLWSYLMSCIGSEEHIRGRVTRMVVRARGDIFTVLHIWYNSVLTSYIIRLTSPSGLGYLLKRLNLAQITY